MLDSSGDLRGAGEVRATNCRRLVGVIADLLATRGTFVGHEELALAAISLVGVGAD